MKKILLILLWAVQPILAQKTIIHCGNLIDVKTLKVLPNMSITVQGKKIVSVSSGFINPEKRG